MYDVFKAGAYLNDIPHTFSSNAYSPYSGHRRQHADGDVPAGALPTRSRRATGATSRWATTAATAGGYVEWQKNSPWYFRVDGNQVTFSGTKVGSAANGTSPGNGFVDLAFPTQYTTNNWGVEGGYQTSKATFSLRWDYSQFDNDNQTLQWTNPFFGGNQLDTTYLPPNNTFNKFTLTGNYRDLPWRSVISARYTWAKTTSDVGLGLTALNTGGRRTARRCPTTDTFNGENINQSFALSWTATPVHERRHARLLLLDEARRTTRRIVEYGNAPTQPLASSLGCGNFTPPDGVPTQIVRQLRERALQLHQEQRRLRRVVEVRARQPAGLRLGLQQPRPDPRRLRQGALEQALGRVQEHDARHGVAAGSSTSTSSGTRRSNFSNDGSTREQPELPAAVHVGVRPAEQHDQPAQAVPRLDPDGRASASRSRAPGARSTSTTSPSAARAPTARATS